MLDSVISAKDLRIEQNTKPISERRGLRNYFCDAEHGKRQGLSYKGTVKTCHEAISTMH
jgi:hypothetical protein